MSIPISSAEAFMQDVQHVFERHRRTGLFTWIEPETGQIQMRMRSAPRDGLGLLMESATLCHRLLERLRRQRSHAPNKQAAAHV